MKKVIKSNKSLGSDISDYQKWVDFDMKKYGKISDTTMQDIKKAGLSVVKDQYGDYEVIGDDKVEGGCHGKKKVESGCHGKKKVNASLDDKIDMNNAIWRCLRASQQILRDLGEAVYYSDNDPEVMKLVSLAKKLKDGLNALAD